MARRVTRILVLIGFRRRGGIPRLSAIMVLMLTAGRRRRKICP